MYPCRFSILALALAVLALPAGVSGQSLSDVAKKERARREKNKQNGVAAEEFSDGALDKANDEDDTEEDAAEVEGDDRKTPEERTDVKRVDIDLEPKDSKTREDDDRARKKREAEFRARYRAAKERVASAREQKRVLDGLRYVQGMKYVDANGNVVIESLEHLRRLVDEANEELETAERALKSLEEEARRGGYPPGWLR